MLNIIRFDNLVSDIVKTIHRELNFPTQVNLRLVSTNFTKYPITNLFDDVPNKYKLTDDILKSYPHVIKLDTNNNHRITDINYLILYNLIL